MIQRFKPSDPTETIAAAVMADGVAILDELDPQLLRLMGYQRGAYGLGYVDDMRDPIAVVRPDLEGAPGFGDEALLRKQFEKMRRFVAGSGAGD